MTNEMTALQGLLEKTSDTDLVREMLGFAAERLMELDVGSKTGAAWGEKSAERLAQRNGYRDRVWETRAGTIELRIPKLRRALVVLLLFLPTNESRAIVGGVFGVGIVVTLLATHFAPGRFYRRMLTWAVPAGFLIHAAGFSTEAGFWGDAAARLQWDGRVGGWFSVAWLGSVVPFIVADLRQSPG